MSWEADHSGNCALHAKIKSNEISEACRTLGDLRQRDHLQDRYVDGNKKTDLEKMGGLHCSGSG